jgi:hypothetical protein
MWIAGTWFVCVYWCKDEAKKCSYFWFLTWKFCVLKLHTQPCEASANRERCSGLGYECPMRSPPPLQSHTLLKRLKSVKECNMYRTALSWPVIGSAHHCECILIRQVSTNADAVRRSIYIPVAWHSCESRTFSIWYAYTQSELFIQGDIYGT